ncbi:MAG TPA: tellurite resistance TerB family protein [Archangium sp.]|uniref:tellurite resistance TerB family protein n=1 Tax=Archangium sp. TaxID=1872627 RepID=UPI002E30B8D9|nr:tellurite resistance TerB family protein [Archangium sp.]HEX5752253.1 tellurite resistance TerB family protein [Archangium sp.]
MLMEHGLQQRLLDGEVRRAAFCRETLAMGGVASRARAKTVSGPRRRRLSSRAEQPPHLPASHSPAARPGDDMTREYPQEQLMAFVQAMANVVASDGRVTEDERQHLDNVVAGVGLSPRDPEVSALIEREFQKPGRLTDIVGKIQSREMRAALLRMIVEVSCADGEIANEERASVKEAAKAFGFDAAIADELINWALDSIKLDQREQEIMSKLL